MRKLVAGIAIVSTLALSACSGPGEVATAQVSLGNSARFSSSEIEAAADAVLAQFRSFRGCKLLRLTYDEASATERRSLSWPPPPATTDVILFTSDFSVDANGGDGSLNPNSTYKDWGWQVTRPNRETSWAVTSWGPA